MTAADKQIVESVVALITYCRTKNVEETETELEQHLIYQIMCA